MVNITTGYFDLRQICKSGQCFRMNEISDGEFEVIAGDKYLRVYEGRVKGFPQGVCFDVDEEEFESFWKHYFDLDTDYGRYIRSVDHKDEYLNRVIKLSSGIRILNQDLWEMIVSFLISQQNNISRIKKCIDNISKKYGTKCINKYGGEYYAFPTPKQLALPDEDALMECNLGYRSKYVVRTANEVHSGKLDLDIYRSCDYERAKTELLKLYGVGKKVADCICLFALHHIDAFPIDTHINQVLEKYYKDGFPFERYVGFAGVIQQYIFFYDLTSDSK